MSFASETGFANANLRGGEVVEYRRYAGLGLRGPEYDLGRGKVNPLLIFPEHVVLNIGGRFGTPQVVNAENFVRVVRRPKGGAR